MKMKITVALLAVTLGACSGGAQQAENAPDIGAANGSTSVPVVSTEAAETVENPYDQSTLDYSTQQAEAQISATDQVTASPDFAFRTSEYAPVALDFVEARGQRATVMVCTSYEPVGSEFSVDYDSCLMRAPLVDGYFEDRILVPTRHQSGIGVVWFAEPGHAPLYREISFAAS